MSTEAKWQTICGYPCCVVCGRVVRGVQSPPGYLDTKTVYPYRKTRNGWTQEVGVKVETLRSGLYRGNYQMI